MIHEVIPVGWLQCNCSVLGDSATKEAIVVDPGDEVERILGVIRQHGLKVQAIVNTHAHIDHVGGLVKMRAATGAPVLMHKEDLELYAILDQQARMVGMPLPEKVTVEEFLEEGRAIRWGRYEASVIHTPGHTKGSCCLHIPAAQSANIAAQGGTKAEEIEEEKLIAGDTLFAGSIGRTDLWGGSMEHILRSIHTKLLALPEETVVYPGHGPETTIGDEREMNPFLQRG